MNTLKRHILAAAVTLLVLAVFVGCSTIVSWVAQPATQTALTTVATDVGALVSDYASTGKVSQAQAIGVGLQSISALAPTVTSNAQLQSLIANTVQQFSGDASPAGASVGQKIAAAVVASLPPAATVSQVSAAIVNAGVGASAGANPTAGQ